jgi:hypothetical protein
VTTQGDPAAANRELTARIARLTWIGRIAAVGAGLLVVGAVVWLLVGMFPATGSRRAGRGNAMVFAVAIGAAFLLPFLGVRRLFRWLLAVRRRSWIVELARKHSCDEDRLRRLAEAISELA